MSYLKHGYLPLYKETLLSQHRPRSTYLRFWGVIHMLRTSNFLMNNYNSNSHHTSISKQEIVNKLSNMKQENQHVQLSHVSDPFPSLLLHLVTYETKLSCTPLNSSKRQHSPILFANLTETIRGILTKSTSLIKWCLYPRRQLI